MDNNHSNDSLTEMLLGFVLGVFIALPAVVILYAYMKGIFNG